MKKINLSLVLVSCGVGMQAVSELRDDQRALYDATYLLTGTVTRGGSFALANLTPGLPLVLDSDLNVVSQTIDIASQTSGVMPISLGGTNATTPLHNNCLMQSQEGQIIEAPALQDGQLFIGATGSAPQVATLTGTEYQIMVSNGPGAITLSTAQNIDPTSTPTFAGITLQQTGTPYTVSLVAPSAIGASYAVSMPAGAPIPGQVLQAASTSALQWGNVSDPYTLYVSVGGSDVTGNGSLSAPFASLKKALAVANLVASQYTPVKISVGPGIFVEDTSGGPLTINPVNQGGYINIAGTSSETTIFTSYTTTQTFIYMPVSGRLSDIAVLGIAQAPGICADGAGNGSAFINAVTVGCQQGFVLQGGIETNYYVSGVATEGCSTAITVDNARALLYNSTFDGTMETSITPANIGVLVTGPVARMVSESCSFLYCSVCGLVANQGNATFIGGSFISSLTGVQATTQATCIVNGATFYENGSINMIAQDPGTTLQSTGCNIDGMSLNNIPQGMGLLVTQSAQANLAVASLTNLVNGIQIGNTGDDGSTQLLAVGVTINNCTGMQIIQNGQAQLTFVDGAFNRTQLSIADPTSIMFNSTDASSQQSTVIGQHIDATQDLILIDVGTAQLPALTYQSNFMDCKGLVYLNPQAAFSTMLGVQGQESDATLSAVTASNTQNAKVLLYSNAGALGGTDAMRGWIISKNGSQAQLAGNFYNNDLDGQPAIDQYTSFQFDGFNNVLQFPAVTTTNVPTYTVAQIQWAGDTNLYRGSAGLLQTDNNFAIQGLSSANAALYADATKQIAASITSADDLAQLAGITGGPVQTQINNKVSTYGDIMSGPLTLPTGAAAAPALNFAGFSQTGLAVIGNVLTAVTMGSSRVTIDAHGIVGIASASAGSTTLTVTGGVFVTGNLIVTSTITANSVSIQSSPVAPTDGANKAYVDSVAQGLQVKSPCVALAATAVSLLSGTEVIDDVPLSAGNRVLLIAQADGVQNGIWTVQEGAWTRPSDFATGSDAQAAYTFILSGTTFADTGYFCTTLNPYAVIDTDTLTFVQFSNTQEVNGQNLGSGVNIFAQKFGQTLQFKSLDAGPNIALTSSETDITIGLPPTLNVAGGITSGASITGASVSDGIGTLSQGTLTALSLIATATITAAQGTGTAPSINFAGSPYTGLAAPLPNMLALITSGTPHLCINASGTVSIPTFNLPGVVHNDSSGNLWSSLIMNADIAPSAAITDSKLSTIQSSGKVANSATSGTNLSSPNTLVLRDSGGNFYAGTVSAALQAPAGTVTSPSITFTSSRNAGLSSPVAGQLSLSSGGVERLQLQAGGALYIPGFVSNNGVVKSTSGILSSAPIYNTDIAVGAGIENSKLAPLTSANMVANSATTATSANTAGALIARDALGNFAASQATLAAATNQLVLNTGNTVTLNAAAPTAARTYTIPDTGTATSTFIMADGPQTINGAKTFNGLTIGSGSLTVGSQAGAIVAADGVYSPSVGDPGQRLATFGGTPTVGWYRPIQPSCESFLFDDFNALFNYVTGFNWFGESVNWLGGDTNWFTGGTSGEYGTVSSAAAVGKEIGVVQISTGGFQGGSTVINKQLNGTVLGNGTCYVEWRVAIPTFSTTSQAFTFRCGLGDTSVGQGDPANNPTTGIWFEHSGTSASPVWLINCASGGSTSTYTTTQAIVAGTYYRLGLLVDAAAEHVYFYVNDVLVGVSSGVNPITTNIPTSLQPVGLFAHIIQSHGNTARVANLDYALYHYVYTSQR